MKQLNLNLSLTNLSLKTKTYSGVQTNKIGFEVTRIFTKGIDLVFKHRLEIRIEILPKAVFKTQTDITTKMYIV